MDALFTRDVGFYVFTLPFVSFVVTWALVALVVALIVTNGLSLPECGIRATRVTPRVAPKVKAHLSVIGAGIALMKAIGYIIAKWELVNSSNAFVQGAGYTDVHARMPALTILIYLSLRRRADPARQRAHARLEPAAVAVGLWGLRRARHRRALTDDPPGLKVTPNQDSLEAPYIQRIIEATRAAFNLDKVEIHTFAGATTISNATIKADTATLNNIRLWDPASEHRARHGHPSPVDPLVLHVLDVVGRPLLHQRQAHAGADRGAPTQYPEPAEPGLGSTSTCSTRTASAPRSWRPIPSIPNGQPALLVSNVPPSSTSGMPVLTQPAIYFGINDPGWVVANTKQSELDYQGQFGTSAARRSRTTTPRTGGVAVGSLFSRLAFALRLGDFNFMISNQITSKSRVLFVRDVAQMAQKAARSSPSTRTPTR